MDASVITVASTSVIASSVHVSSTDTIVSTSTITTVDTGGHAITTKTIMNTAYTINAMNKSNTIKDYHINCVELVPKQITQSLCKHWMFIVLCLLRLYCPYKLQLQL